MVASDSDSDGIVVHKPGVSDREKKEFEVFAAGTSFMYTWIDRKEVTHLLPYSAMILGQDVQDNGKNKRAKSNGAYRIEIGK